VDWIHLTQNKVQRQDLVKVKMYCTFFYLEVNQSQITRLPRHRYTLQSQGKPCQDSAFP